MLANGSVVKANPFSHDVLYGGGSFCSYCFPSLFLLRMGGRISLP